MAYGLKRPLTADELDALVAGNYLSPEAADGMRPRQLEQLDRDGAVSDPSAVAANDNALGTPSVLDTVSGLPISKYLGGPESAVVAAAGVKPPPPPPAPDTATDIDIGKGIKPPPMSLLTKPIVLPEGMQNQGAAFGAPPNRDDLTPNTHNGVVQLGKVSPETAKGAAAVAEDQAANGLLDHQKSFSRMADNPSLRGGADSGPVVPEDPNAPGGIQPAHALAAGAAGANKAISKYKQDVQAIWDGYVGAPIDKQIDIARRQGDLAESLANESYKAADMAQTIASASKQRDADYRAKEVQEQQDKLNDLEKENQKVRDTKIDPDRFWSSKTTFEKLGMVIGALLGGFSGNPGILTRIVDADVDIQMKNMTSKRKYIEDQRGVLSDQMKNLNDKNATREAARAALIESVSGQVALIAKKFGGPEAQMKAEAVQSDLEKQKADSYAKLWNFLNPDPRRAAGGGGLPKSLTYDGDKIVNLPDGRSFIAADGASATQLREGVSAAEEAMAAIERMKELNKNPRTYIPGSAENNEYDSQVQRLRLATDSKFLGVAKSAEGREILNAATAIPSVYSAQTEKKLDKFKDRVREHLGSGIRAQDGTYITSQFVNDPTTGLPKRVAIPTGETTRSYGLTTSPGGGTVVSPVKPGAAPAKGK